MKPTDWQPTLIREFLDAAKETQRWIVPGFIAHEGLTLISAPRKLGLKTWLADFLAILVTEGINIGDFRCLDPGPVLYFEEEGTPLGTSLRWEGLEFTYGVDLRQNENLYYSFRPRLLLDDAEWAASIIRAVQKVKPRMVIFDALTYMHKADENRTHEMRAVVDTLQSIRASGTACVFLAHTNAEASRDPNLDIDLGVRGSRVILDAYDVHVGLRRWDSDSRVSYDEKTSIVWGETQWHKHEISCRIRQREGSELVYQLAWDLISEWNYDLEAEEVWYVYPHLSTEDDMTQEQALEYVAEQLDFKRAYSLRTIANKLKMRQERLHSLLTKLAQLGEVEASNKGGLVVYRRLK